MNTVTDQTPFKNFPYNMFVWTSFFNSNIDPNLFAKKINLSFLKNEVFMVLLWAENNYSNVKI